MKLLLVTPMNLTDLDTLIPLLKKHGLYTNKRFGQHFLINEAVLNRIVEAAELQATDVVVEIGVGPGALTRELAKRVKQVRAYEIDDGLEGLLTEETLAEFGNVELTFADFLKVRPSDYIPDNGRFKVVANLPYNVGSHIIDRLLKHQVQPSSITVLLQREVAEKIVSEAPNGTYLKNFVAGYGQARLAARVRQGDFFPAPKVESAVLQIAQSGPSLIAPEDMTAWSGFLHRGFRQPRKKLNKAFDKALLEEVGINPDFRPQQVGVDEWKRLFDRVRQHSG